MEKTKVGKVGGNLGWWRNKVFCWYNIWYKIVIWMELGS